MGKKRKSGNTMGTPGANAEELKAEGNQLYKDEKYFQASVKYTEAINADDKQATYFNNRAACFLMMNNPIRALEDTQKATAMDPQMAKGWSRMAKCALLLGNKLAANKAGSKLKQMEEREGAEILAKVDVLTKCEESGEPYLADGKYSDAAHCYKLALQLAPHSNQLRVKLALCLGHQGMFPEAMGELKKVIKNDAKNTEALFVRGLCFYYQEKTDRALESFEMVLKIDPDHERAKEKSKQSENSKKLKDSGNEAFKSGNFENALDNYGKALTVDPMNKSLNSKLYFNRATVHSKLGDLQKCVGDCTKALDNDPNYLKPLLRRAKSYVELKDFVNAVKDYEKAHELGL